MLFLRGTTPAATSSGRASPVTPPSRPPLPVQPPCRRLRSPTACAAAPPAGDDPAAYAARILAAEEAGDWLAAVEVLTEVREKEAVAYRKGVGHTAGGGAVPRHSSPLSLLSLSLSQIRILRVDAPAAAYEAAARVCADEGDWKKAVDALLAAETAAGEGTPAGAAAVEAVFRRLARELEGGAALDLLARLAPTWAAHSHATRSAATNCATRACARGGRLEDGLRLLEEGLRGGDLRIEAGTLDCLAVAAQAAGRVDLYEELLEERDYLL